MKLRLFIAGRYLFAKKSHNVINIVSAISAAGMAVGAAALIIILSIYNGFDSLVKSMLSSVEPDIAIRPVEGKFFTVTNRVWTGINGCPHIKSCEKVLQDNLFVSYDNHQATVVAKGVDTSYFSSSPLKDYVKEGNLPKGKFDCAVIGIGIARELNIGLSFFDKMEFYYPLREGRISTSNPLSALSCAEVKPGCIFSVNNEIDNSLIYIDKATMASLLQFDNGEISSIEIRFDEGIPFIERSQLERHIEAIVGEKFNVLTRAEQNPATYNMLRYEKAAVYLIMIFIVMILGFSIFGSMSMLMIDKSDDISAFRSMGAPESWIRDIFTFEGALITILGSAAGLAVGTVFSLLQEHYGIISLPGNYIVDAYPAVLQWSDVILAFISISILGYVIARIATFSHRFNYGWMRKNR